MGIHGTSGLHGKTLIEVSQELKYLRGNAEVIAEVESNMLSGNTPHDQVQSQIENLAFLSQTRVQVYDTHDQLLYDSGSPQNASINLDNLNQMSALKSDGPLHRLLIISITTKQNSKPTSSAATPSAVTPEDKFLFGSSQTVPVASSPFGFDLSSDTTTGGPRSKLTIAELIHDPKTGNDLGSVRLSEGPDYGSAILRSVARGWMFASVIAVLLAVGIGWYISRRISAPILALTDVTGRMAHGDLSSRANVESRDEFGQLGRSFNEMAVQVEKTVTTLRLFVSDAAHEIRTPLTVLRTNLDLMLDEKDAADRVAFVADAKAMV